MGAGPSKVAEKREKVATEDLGWDDAPTAAQMDSEEEDEVKAGSKLSETDMKDAQVSFSIPTPSTAALSESLG